MIRDAIKTIREKAPIQAYTLEELAFLYNVTSPTVKNWIKPFKDIIGKKTGWYYTIRQIEIIFEKIGHP